MTQPQATPLSMPSNSELELRGFVAAPRRAIFGAWTDPRLVPQWLLGPPGWSMPVCELDLRVGGRWRFVYRKDDGATMELGGNYLEILPPDRLVFAERWGPEWPETRNTLRLTEAEGGTTISLCMLYPGPEAREKARATGLREGFEQGLRRLEALLKPQS